MRAHCPDRGDIVWLSFDPRRGHEQSGDRPALALSPASYNRKAGLAIFCPITKQTKGYPFEIQIPSGLKVQGVVLADQAKSLDWESRNARFCCRIPPSTLSEVVSKLGTLLQIEPTS